MRDPSSVQVSGPLAPFVQGFSARLKLLDYAMQSRAGHLRLMADLSDWLGRRGLDGSALSTQAVDEFVRDRRVAGHRDARSARSLTPLLEYLRVTEAVPLPVAQPVAGPVETVLAGYACYLVQERGLSVLTAAGFGVRFLTSSKSKKEPGAEPFLPNPKPFFSRLRTACMMPVNL